MRRFNLLRLEDPSGVSGLGIVAEGVEFSNGSCALVWLTDIASVGLYPSISHLEQIHGHNGNTLVIWQDGPEEKE